MSNVSLAVNGTIYEGWKDVQVRMSLKAISGSFSLSVSDRWTDKRQAWKILPGDECELKVEKQTVITGFVDSTSPSFDTSGRAIQISGRDKTADFVDCSVDLGRFEFKKIKLETLARTLAAQFGLNVSFSGDSGRALDNIVVNPGETAFEVLEKACRQKGFLLTTDGLGSIVVMQPSGIRTATSLEQGKNIIQAAAQHDFTDRFSNYRVIAQNGSALGTHMGVAAFTVQARATDEAVTRTRPKLFVAEGAMAKDDAQRRVNWEASTRAAKSTKIRITTQGWLQQNGTLWLPNQIVRVKAPWLFIDGDMLVTSVMLSKNDSAGTIAELELEREDAYLPEPIVKKKLDPLAVFIGGGS